MLLARASGLEGFARHVVIKRIHENLAREERFVLAFLEEARISASLHHQNIVQVHDIGDEGGAIYFAMEYVHGEDLRKLLNRVRERGGLVPLQHVVAIVMATAAGLDYAHEQVKPGGESKGIVHRDIAPANILIGYDGSVKLVDFGLARAAQRSTHATSSGTLKGKSSYMSPEQCTGRPVDRRTDTFSLGIVLFELLTAQRLFKGANEFMTMGAIVDGEIPRPSSLRGDVPPALDEIVMRALARAPESRYQTAEAMRESLEAFAVAQELRTSAKSLADYLVSLFGERQEPWLAEPEPDPAWDVVEATHAGLVAVPRNPQDLLARFSTQAESPLTLAKASQETNWGDDEDRDVATSGQLPSLLRGQPTEPTQTVRKAPPVVSPNVRPRGSEPPKSVPAEPAMDITAVLPPAMTFELDAPTVRPGAPKATDTSRTDTIQKPDLASPQETTATQTNPAQPLPGRREEPGSSTLVEPPIFDGGIKPLVGRADDDDGLDEEVATEIALDLPRHEPEPVKETVPMALRRQPRQDPHQESSHELKRGNSATPAPLRPASRVMLPGAPGMRDVTPPGSPPMPPGPPMAGNTPPGQFAGVDPAAIAAGFQQPMRGDPTSHVTPAHYDPSQEQIDPRGGSRPLVIIGVGVVIVVAGLLAMRACGNSASETAPTPDAQVEPADASEPVTSPADAAVHRVDAGVRDAGVRDAGLPRTHDAGTTPKRPPKRPPLRRPKGK